MSTPEQSISYALGAAFNATLIKLMKEWQVPGVSLAVVKSTRDGTFEELTRSYGTWDGVHPVCSNTLFPIMSLSKVFSVIAVGHALKQAGHTKGYHTPIKEILSNFQLADPVATLQCTVADICSHVTGLPGYNFIYNTHSNNMDVLERLKILQPSCAFRQKFQYTNFMFEIVSLIVEELTGMKFGNYVKKEILDPLHMDKTGYEANEKTAIGFWSPNQPREQVEDIFPLSNGLLHMGSNVGFASTRMFSTANNMVLWMKALLSMPEYELAATPYVDTCANFFMGSYYADTAPTYGMGLFQGKIQGFQFIEHFGASAGFRSTMTHYPDLGLSMTVLTNSTEGEGICAWMRGAVPYIALNGGGPSSIWENQVRKDRIKYVRHLKAAYKAVPASGSEHLLGVFTATGYLTFSLDPSNFLRMRPKCTLLPWIPAWCGNICPVLASLGGGKFEGCFEWSPWDGGEIQYGYPFQVTERNRDELLVCGLSDLGYGLRAEDHPIVFTRE